MTTSLNDKFLCILKDPFNQEIWTKLDIECLMLSKEGYCFKRKRIDNEIPIKCLTPFNLNDQMEFIQLEIKQALNLQLYKYLNDLLKYKNVISRIKESKLASIKITSTEYFTLNDNTILYRLTNHPLINLKLIAIIDRRCNNENPVLFNKIKR